MKKTLSRLFVKVTVISLLLVDCRQKAEDPFIAVGGDDLSQTVICPRQVLLKEFDRDVDGLFHLDTQYSFVLPEPLGYRGIDYWRFDIHFDTVYKTDLLRYSVLGRTRYRDTVRRFSGEIILDSLSIVWTLDSLDDFFYRLARYTDIDYGAYLHGHYFFREDTTAHGAGLLQGRVIYSVIHEKGTLCYDPEGIDYADGYDNNQYQGTWSLSDGSRSVPCNWGHFRIPNSQRLDSGVGEFNPDSQYVNNGWQLHHLLLNAVYGTPQYDSIHAQYEADRNWWCK